MLTTTWITVLLLALCVSELEAGWIDPDTENSAESIESYVDGKVHKLVFSDEFNTEGRYFHDGSDPRWTSINKDDYTNYALHYYNADLVKTSNGFLNITTEVKDIEFVFEDVVGDTITTKKATKNYQSGMLQGWNKFCFTGGIVEISAR
jgi:beta-glucanase (GH16 family)